MPHLHEMAHRRRGHRCADRHREGRERHRQGDEKGSQEAFHLARDMAQRSILFNDLIQDLELDGETRYTGPDATA